MIKVSVIVPVFNADNFLKQCLDSLIGQTYSNYEIICVDDCSSDSSREILSEYCECFSDKINILFNERNIGQGRSRMRGLKLASGDYIMFVDSDDYVASDYIERFVYESADASFDLIVGGYTRDVDGSLSKYVPTNSVWSVVTYSVACCKMIRRSFIESHSIDFSNARKGEDIYFNLSLYYWQPNYKVIPYSGYYYRLNRTSTTQTLGRNHNFDVIIFDMFDDFLDCHDLSVLDDNSRNVIEYSYLANVYNALLTYCRGCGFKEMLKKLQNAKETMKRQFPDYSRNPLIGLLSPKDQSLKIRLALFVMVKWAFVGVDKLVLSILSVA